MTCYAVPLTTAVLVHAFGEKVGLKGERRRRLEQWMGGGAIFGVVDHWWNGELFLVGPFWQWDLALGVAITIAITGVWAVNEIVLSRQASRSTS